MHQLLALTVFLQALYLAHSQLHPSFAQWKSSLGKNYADSSEEHYRSYIYNKNVEQIQKHNDDPLRTYEQGVNKFTDLTSEEFTLTYLTLSIPSPDPDVQNVVANDDDHPIVGAYVITAIDWRTKLNSTNAALVPKVRNQASCGSCWAFSAASAMEYGIAVQFKLIANISTQQLVSCANSSAGYGNYGCNGGWMNQAFRYGKTSKISDLYQYPYVSGSGTTYACDMTKRNKGKFNVSSYVTISTNYTTDTLCSPMLQRLKTAPYSVALNATVLQSYRSGILVPTSCGTGINHGVLAIGNDALGNWIIQNSWGTSWGQSGYFRLGKGNTCSICKSGAMTVTMNKP